MRLTAAALTMAVLGWTPAAVTTADEDVVDSVRMILPMLPHCKD